MTHSVVLIGHGAWGKKIARNFYELDCLYGVCEPSEPSRETASKLYPEVRLFETFEDVLADERVGAVAIAAPAELHSSLSLAALEAGKDVFVEKPLALRFENGRRVVKRAHVLGRILMVGHVLEYHYAIAKLVEVVRAGDLGDLQYIYSNRLNLGKFRSEENILWSFAPHDIAVILRLVGDSPIEVVATGGAYLQPNLYDTTVTNLLFENGVRAHIFVSWLHPYKEQRLVVVGSKKMAVFDDLLPVEQKLIVHDKGADWLERRPVARRGDGTPVELTVSEPLKAEMKHFIDCVEKRRQPLTDGINGLRVLEVLQSAQRSLRTGGGRVQLATHAYDIPEPAYVHGD